MMTTTSNANSYCPNSFIDGVAVKGFNGITEDGLASYISFKVSSMEVIYAPVTVGQTYAVNTNGVTGFAILQNILHCEETGYCVCRFLLFQFPEASDIDYQGFYFDREEVLLYNNVIEIRCRNVKRWLSTYETEMRGLRSYPRCAGEIVQYSWTSVACVRLNKGSSNIALVNHYCRPKEDPNSLIKQLHLPIKILSKEELSNFLKMKEWLAEGHIVSIQQAKENHVFYDDSDPEGLIFYARYTFEDDVIKNFHLFEPKNMQGCHLQFKGEKNFNKPRPQKPITSHNEEYNIITTIDYSRKGEDEFSGQASNNIRVSDVNNSRYESTSLPCCRSEDTRIDRDVPGSRNTNSHCSPRIAQDSLLLDAEKVVMRERNTCTSKANSVEQGSQEENAIQRSREAIKFPRTVLRETKELLQKSQNSLAPEITSNFKSQISSDLVALSNQSLRLSPRNVVVTYLENIRTTAASKITTPSARDFRQIPSVMTQTSNIREKQMPNTKKLNSQEKNPENDKASVYHAKGENLPAKQDLLCPVLKNDTKILNTLSEPKTKFNFPSATLSQNNQLGNAFPGSLEGALNVWGSNTLERRDGSQVSSQIQESVTVNQAESPGIFSQFTVSSLCSDNVVQGFSTPTSTLISVDARNDNNQQNCPDTSNVGGNGLAFQASENQSSGIKFNFPCTAFCQNNQLVNAFPGSLQGQLPVPCSITSDGRDGSQVSGQTHELVPNLVTVTQTGSSDVFSQFKVSSPFRNNVAQELSTPTTTLISVDAPNNNYQQSSLDKSNVGGIGFTSQASEGQSSDIKFNFPCTALSQNNKLLNAFPGFLEGALTVPCCTTLDVRNGSNQQSYLDTGSIGGNGFISQVSEGQSSSIKFNFPYTALSQSNQLGNALPGPLQKALTVPCSTTLEGRDGSHQQSYLATSNIRGNGFTSQASEGQSSGIKFNFPCTALSKNNQLGNAFPGFLEELNVPCSTTLDGRNGRNQQSYLDTSSISGNGFTSQASEGQILGSKFNFPCTALSQSNQLGNAFPGPLQKVLTVPCSSTLEGRDEIPVSSQTYDIVSSIGLINQDKFLEGFPRYTESSPCNSNVAQDGSVATVRNSDHQILSSNPSNEQDVSINAICPSSVLSGSNQLLGEDSNVLVAESKIQRVTSLVESKGGFQKFIMVTTPSGPPNNQGSSAAGASGFVGANYTGINGTVSQASKDQRKKVQFDFSCTILTDSSRFLNEFSNNTLSRRNVQNSVLNEGDEEAAVQGQLQVPSPPSIIADLDQAPEIPDWISVVRGTLNNNSNINNGKDDVAGNEGEHNALNPVEIEKKRQEATASIWKDQTVISTKVPLLTNAALETRILDTAVHSECTVQATSSKISAQDKTTRSVSTNNDSSNARCSETSCDQAAINRESHAFPCCPSEDRSPDGLSNSNQVLHPASNPPKKTSQGLYSFKRNDQGQAGISRQVKAHSTINRLESEEQDTGIFPHLIVPTSSYSTVAKDQSNAVVSSISSMEPTGNILANSLADSISSGDANCTSDSDSFISDRSSHAVSTEIFGQNLFHNITTFSGLGSISFGDISTNATSIAVPLLDCTNNKINESVLLSKPQMENQSVLQSFPTSTIVRQSSFGEITNHIPPTTVPAWEAISSRTNETVLVSGPQIESQNVLESFPTFSTLQPISFGATSIPGLSMSVPTWVSSSSRTNDSNIISQSTSATASAFQLYSNTAQTTSERTENEWKMVRTDGNNVCPKSSSVESMKNTYRNPKRGRPRDSAYIFSPPLQNGSETEAGKINRSTGNRSTSKFEFKFSQPYIFPNQRLKVGMVRKSSHLMPRKLDTTVQGTHDATTSSSQVYFLADSEWRHSTEKCTLASILSTNGQNTRNQNVNDNDNQVSSIHRTSSKSVAIGRKRNWSDIPSQSSKGSKRPRREQSTKSLASQVSSLAIVVEDTKNTKPLISYSKHSSSRNRKRTLRDHIYNEVPLNIKLYLATLRNVWLDNGNVMLDMHNNCFRSKGKKCRVLEKGYFKTPNSDN